MIQLHCARAINPLYKNPFLRHHKRDWCTLWLRGHLRTPPPWQHHKLPTELSTIGEQRSDEQNCNANKRVGETYKEKNTHKKIREAFLFLWVCVLGRRRTIASLDPDYGLLLCVVTFYCVPIIMNKLFLNSATIYEQNEETKSE